VGLRVAGRHHGASCRGTSNIFEKNRTARICRGAGAGTHSTRNLYVGNDVGLSLHKPKRVGSPGVLCEQRTCRRLPRTLGPAAHQATFRAAIRANRCPIPRPTCWSTAGPSGLLLENCRFTRDEPVEFAPDRPAKPPEARWVVSAGHNETPAIAAVGIVRNR